MQTGLPSSPPVPTALFSPLPCNVALPSEATGRKFEKRRRGGEEGGANSEERPSTFQKRCYKKNGAEEEEEAN